MTAIVARELRKTYGDLTALSTLSIEIDAGELFGFLGPNGAGKTTTLGILTGQLVPDSGTAEVLGVDPIADPVAVRRRIGILPEQESPPSFMTPREYFRFVGQVRELDPDRVEARVRRWTERLAFTDKLDVLATDLSRGQQQKTMITQAFLHEPDAVFIDEPLTNLDPIIQERFKRALREYRDDGGTVFLSTHDIDVAETLCSRVGIIANGELVGTRRPAALDSDESLLEVFLADVNHVLEAGP